MKKIKRRKLKDSDGKNKLDRKQSNKKQRQQSADENKSLFDAFMDADLGRI